MASQRDISMVDVDAAEDDQRQYGHDPMSEEELSKKYPNRPHNHSKTLPFHQLYTTLFDQLNKIKKKPAGHIIARAKQGPHGSGQRPPHEARRDIIERFMSRWRQEVGDDFYPALRLIIPEKDRDRAMYGLKEKAIGRLLVKLIKIDKNSSDAQSLLDWKLPGNTYASRMAGDFAGRCFEVLSKRPMRTAVGDMRIAEVNELLDNLSTAQKEETQLPIFNTFYQRMNAYELMWLIRIILRQMKVGATERTFLEVWHPDGEALFNISSSLRHVCWMLYDLNTRLEQDSKGVGLMQCFQPQLAQFQMRSFQKMVDNMRPREGDDEFWIEEKLDGERMQMHMVKDDETPGGYRFGFWSRKAKDYTYLYGNGFEDENSALTRHIKDAFHENAESFILDGEMITWDPEADIMVPFGTLKTAALSEQRNPFAGNGPRPLFRVFDILYLNGRSLTGFELRDRRKALAATITDVHRRIEIHEYQAARTADAIEPLLRKVVAEASEGLVLKNPRSAYRLNSRNDDWIKVKPEYMTEFGESLDCVIVGGYYGSGHRGGRLSSFLCGLRIDQNQINQGANPQKCYSFFKVGGGFKAEDYANVRHHTDSKWIEYDPKNPPTTWLELAGGKLQHERPDVWIKPEDSIVISVKAASVGPSDSFRTGFTLRFPRFKSLRMDKDWSTSLTVDEFTELRKKVEEESAGKAMTITIRRNTSKRVKKELVIVGNDQVKTPYAGPATKLFEGLTLCVLSEGLSPVKKSKWELEELIKANGGVIIQNPRAVSGTIIIADKKVVQVKSIEKDGKLNIVKSRWISDAVAQAEADKAKHVSEKFLVPFEPAHMFVETKQDKDSIRRNVGDFGDSFARDVGLDELRSIMDNMVKNEFDFDALAFEAELIESEGEDVLHDLRGRLFRGLRIYVATEDRKDCDEGSDDMVLVKNSLRFAGAELVDKITDSSITHVVVEENNKEIRSLRQEVATKRIMPRIVTTKWVEDCWNEGTLLDEERYAPLG